VSDPTSLPPLKVELYNINLNANNTLWLSFRFEDGTDLSLEFPSGSPLSHSLFELFEQSANELLNRLGQRGITVTGFTPPAPDHE
jgi:hypothetical protein